MQSLKIKQSISVGVGPPLSPERTRALLALRINVMAKGFSGISLHVLSHYIDAFNGKFANDASGYLNSGRPHWLKLCSHQTKSHVTMM